MGHCVEGRGRGGEVTRYIWPTVRRGRGRGGPPERRYLCIVSVACSCGACGRVPIGEVGRVGGGRLLFAHQIRQVVGGVAGEARMVPVEGLPGGPALVGAQVAVLGGRGRGEARVAGESARGTPSVHVVLGRGGVKEGSGLLWDLNLKQTENLDSQGKAGLTHPLLSFSSVVHPGGQSDDNAEHSSQADAYNHDDEGHGRGEGRLITRRGAVPVVFLCWDGHCYRG